MKKVTKIIAYIFIGLSIIFTITFNIYGSEVDENGMLQESFYLIPLSYTSFVVGIIFLTISLFAKEKN
jgi:hypothetical protein